jgi:phosphotransferase system HPr-like phosphotransfer protein
MNKKAKEIYKMQTCKIKLTSIQDVREFVDIVTGYNIEIDLSSGRYVVDAKSIMGIFSLDLSKPITLEVHSDDCDALVEELKPYIQ